MNVVRVNAFYFSKGEHKGLANALREMASYLDEAKDGDLPHPISNTVSHKSAQWNSTMGCNFTGHVGLFSLDESDQGSSWCSADLMVQNASILPQEFNSVLLVK